jgi:uncharacterized repeat protein (TIGR03803 family)
MRLPFFAFLLAASLSLTVEAQTFTLLHDFTNDPDGAHSSASLIRDGAGNLYGATSVGGNLNCEFVGCGTVFKVNSAGVESVLYTFTTHFDGNEPSGPLLRDKLGNLYGLTSGGGNKGGFGTIFKISNRGRKSTLYTFSGGVDGADPNGWLLMDAAGNLYGVTSQGGNQACTCGTVFKLDPTNHKTILWSFGNAPDGARPEGGLVMDSGGNLYGATNGGGNLNCNVGGTGCGIVFELNPTTGVETILYTFKSQPDAAYPAGGLVRDSAGNFYGTTVGGGSCTLGLNGCGTIFKVDKAGNETVLYSFSGALDGLQPYSTLVRDSLGNLYGTASSGGAFNYGDVFKLDANSNFTVIYNFTGQTDGWFPQAGVIRDAAGNLYGTTFYGGDLPCSGGLGCGSVYKITP